MRHSIIKEKKIKDAILSSVLHCTTLISSYFTQQRQVSVHKNGMLPRQKYFTFNELYAPSHPNI